MVSSKSSSVASGAMPTDATASPKSAATALSSARRWTISLCSSCRVDVVAVFISTVLRWSSALKLLLGNRRRRRGAFGANAPVAGSKSCSSSSAPNVPVIDMTRDLTTRMFREDGSFPRPGRTPRCPGVSAGATIGAAVTMGWGHWGWERGRIGW